MNNIYNEKLKELLEAAQDGSASAQRELARLYHDGEGTAIDYQEAMKWYKRASDQGDFEADNALGLMYLNGEGVSANPKLAFEYFTNAARGGVPAAKANLGWMYETGTWVSEDMKTAFDWYHAAAIDGDVPSMHAVAEMYRNGAGVRQDEVSAKAWEAKAIAFEKGEVPAAPAHTEETEEQYDSDTDDTVNDDSDNGGGFSDLIGGNGNLLKIAAVVLAVLVVICIFAAIQNTKDDDQSPDTGTEDSIADEDGNDNNETSEPDPIHLSYAQVLVENEWAIKNYNWQRDENYEELTGLADDDSQSRSIAVYDINGDGTDELMFMSAESEYEACFHVYTIKNGGPSELSYSISLGSDGETGMYSDLQVAGGSLYMIYAGRNNGTLHIAHQISDDFIALSNNELTMTDSGELYQSSVVYNIYNNWDQDNQYDDYYVNGELVDREDGIAAFKSAGEDYGTLLMYSGYMDSLSVSKHINTDRAIAMSYNEAMEYLQN